MEKELRLPEFSQSLLHYPGQYFLRCEQEQLNKLLPQIYGYYLVQAGAFNGYDLKSASTINHHIYVGRINSASLPNSTVVESNLNELPFLFESVDVFFLPHTLEFCDQPEKLLSEIYNILIPGGKVIIIGFNPYSAIGLTKLLKSDKNVPWAGKLISLREVTNKLTSIGFSIDFTKYICFKPPFAREHALDKMSFLESLGKRFFPVLGSVYVLVAEKKAIPLSPVKLKVFEKKIPVTRGFPEPSTNKGL
jgi:SAM-dependent methyltransferase